MDEKHIFKLLPALKDYLWGGKRLETFLKKNEKGLLRIAESWEISTHPDGESLIELEKCLTPLKKLTGDIPFIVKYIDAAEDLSVQVHPDEEYARLHEKSGGKNEMWLILEAEREASIYLGFNRDVSRMEVEKSVENGEFLSLLNKIPVKRGEVYFIPSGAVHAIGKGCFICEIQQSSNITYRLYDYKRTGADGKPRELHLKKALDVLNYKKNQLGVADGVQMLSGFFERIVNDYKLYVYCGEGEFFLESPSVFALLYEGAGMIECGVEKICAFAGETYFCDFGKIKISGNCKAIIIAAA